MNKNAKFRDAIVAIVLFTSQHFSLREPISMEKLCNDVTAIVVDIAHGKRSPRDLMRQLFVRYSLSIGYQIEVFYLLRDALHAYRNA